MSDFITNMLENNKPSPKQPSESGKSESPDPLATPHDASDENVTRVGAGAEILGNPFKFNVSNPNRKKCPEGFYWVSQYKKGYPPFQTIVQGHCRKAGSSPEDGY